MFETFVVISTRVKGIYIEAMLIIREYFALIISDDLKVKAVRRQLLFWLIVASAFKLRRPPTIEPIAQ